MITLPRRMRGRPSRASQEAWDNDCRQFANQLIQIKKRLGGKRQACRSWCYDLEPYGLDKNDFDIAEKFINDLRKKGLLPGDFTAEDDTRKANGIEGYIDDTTPEEEAQYIVDTILDRADSYDPVSFWATQEYYVEMVVEKMDLRRNSFARALRRYPIPCTNGKGWSDINSRQCMAFRFQEHEEEGRTPVLLYCGDHDPKGIQIAETIRSNLQDMDGMYFESGACVNWNARFTYY